MRNAQRSIVIETETSKRKRLERHLSRCRSAFRRAPCGRHLVLSVAGTGHSVVAQVTRPATPPPGQDKPEVTTVGAVDEKVNGRVEGQQKVGDIRDVSTEEIQSRGIECHLDGPDDL